MRARAPVITRAIASSFVDPRTTVNIGLLSVPVNKLAGSYGSNTHCTFTMMGNADTPNLRLQLAAQKNDVPGLQRELANGAEVDYIDPVFCWTALQVASLDGKSEAVDILLRAGANPDIVNDGGNTALHMASRNGQVKCVELLCTAGANLDILNEAGKIAREEAAERVTRQFRYNGTSHQGVLETIDKEFDLRESRILCSALQRLAFAAGTHERLGAASALQVAALPRRPADGSWELIDLVIPSKHGDLTSKRNTGPAFRWAQFKGWAWRDHQFKMLRSSGPHPTANEAEPPTQQHLKGQRGKMMGATWIPTGSALHDAVNIGNLSAVHSELAAVRTTIRISFSLAICLAKQSFSAWCSLKHPTLPLPPQGTSTECVNQGYLETPLHRAAVKGDAATVRALLAANANLQAKRSGGFTPLHTAQTTEVARLLLDSGADPSAMADNGKTPVEQAAGGSQVQSFIAEYQPQFTHRCMFGNPAVPGGVRPLGMTGASAGTRDRTVPLKPGR